MDEATRLQTRSTTFHYYIMHVGGDSDHLYPCTWVADTTAYISIHSKSFPGEDPYNQNQITFLMSASGWSDMPRIITVLESNLYDYNEVTIHSVYAGIRQGTNCIYLRGGLYYRIWSNVTIVPHTTEVTINEEVFGIMNSDFTISNASNILKYWDYTMGVTFANGRNGAAISLIDQGAPTTTSIQLAFSGQGLESDQVNHLLAFDNRQTGTNKIARDFSFDKLKAKLGSMPANGGNADTVDNLHAAAVGSVEAGKLASYDVDGYMHANIFRDHWVTADFTTVGEVCFRESKDSGYHYFCSLSRFKSVLGNMPSSDYSNYLKVNDLRASAIVPTYGTNEIIGWFNNLGTPTADWWSGIHVKGWSETYQAWQLAGPSDSLNPSSDALYYKSGRNNTWNAWRRLAFADEIPSLSGYATQSWVQSQGYKTTDNNYYPTAVSWSTATAEGPNIRITGTGMSTINAVIPSASATQSGTIHCGTQTIAGAKTFTSYTIFPAGSGTSSDIRLKENIEEMTDAEYILSNLSGYRYVVKDTDRHYAGLIAQEVQKVLPEAVQEDENGFLTVDTYPIVAALVEANKAKDERIAKLENRLSFIEDKMSAILN